MFEGLVQKKQPAYLNKYSRIPPSSEDWSKIEYSLQTSLGSSTASIRNIWAIANPNMSQNFQKRNKDLLMLDSYIDASYLDDANRIDKVCQRGFDFPPGGLLFPTGHLSVNSEVQNSKNRIYEFLMVKVAVGKSFCVSMKNNNMIKEKKKLPYGFDSVYLIHDDDQEEQDKVFKHDYIVFDNSQVLPLYIIHFEFDTDKEEALSTPLCDICQENQANVYCKAEESNLCFFCDEEHHAKLGKLVVKHNRVPINERPRQFGKCQQHPDQTLEFFDPIDNQPLCVYCKINGSHSSGEKSGHPLVKISEAYTKAIAESKDIDPILEKKKNQLTDTLSTIDQRIKEINQNASDVEEQIYHALQESLKMLQEETQRKLSFLIADQIEIKRQYEQIQWLQSFLRYQQDILNPPEYLHSWSRHLTLRSELVNTNSVPTVANVVPDMRLEGRLNIISDTKARIKGLQDRDFNEPEELAGLASGNKFKSNFLSKLQEGSHGKALYGSIKNMLPSSAHKLHFDPNDSRQQAFNAHGDSATQDYLNQSGVKNQGFKDTVSLLNQSINKENNPAQGNQAQSLPMFSLKACANDKMIQLRKNPDPRIQSGEIFDLIFQNSMILEPEEKKILYLNLPFDLTNPPSTNLIWYRHDPNSQGPEMQELFAEKKNQYPNFIVFKHKNQKFGGFSSSPWHNKKATIFGDRNCFLFNIGYDAKLLPLKQGDITYLWQGPEAFSFGTRDLQVEDNFDQVSSQIEQNYYSGRKMSSEETMKFLTGVVGKFTPDAIEIFTIIPNEF